MKQASTNPSPLLGWGIFILGATFYSYEFLLRILPSFMTADLMQVHHLTTAGFGYLIAIYYVIYTAMQIPVGLLIDWYGPRQLLLIASAICACGSFLFASPHSVIIAGIGRFLIGLGSAFGFVGVLRLASIWLPSHRFALATGLVTTLGMIGGVAGDVGLSHLVAYAGWHIAIILSGWAGIVLTAVFWWVPESTLTLVSDTDKEQQWHHLVAQLKTIMRMPAIWVNGIVGCLLYVPLSAFGELWGVSYLQSAQQLSRVDATLATSWLMWGWAIGAPLAGWVADKTGSRNRVIVIGGLLSIVTILSILHTQFASHLTLYFMLFLFGLLCSGQILIMVIVRDLCPHPLLATSLALTNMIIMGGGMIVQPMVGVLLKSASTDVMAQSTAPALISLYTHIMYIVPIAIAFGVILNITRHLFYKSNSGK
jgi:MFS family permease